MGVILLSLFDKISMIEHSGFPHAVPNYIDLQDLFYYFIDISIFY